MLDLSQAAQGRGDLPVRKIKMGAAGQNDENCRSSSQRVFLSHFFVASERDEGVPVGTAGSCEVVLGMYGTPTPTVLYEATRRYNIYIISYNYYCTRHRTVVLNISYLDLD